LSRFAIFKELADFFSFSFKTRRLILLALIVSSVPGTFYWHMPATARWWFLMGYVWLIILGIMSQTGFFVQFARTAFGAVVFGRRYRPVPFSSPEIDALARKMKILGKVRVYSTNNPWINGPFTNALTSRVYVPLSWIKSFPKSEIIAVLGHEFGHVTRRLRFGLELALGIILAYSFALFLNLLTVMLVLVFEVAEIAAAFLLVSFVSWRSEYRADRDGAKATGPEGLISVFEKVRQKSGKDEGSETHPPLSNRIRRLEPLLDEPQS
jgi:Zn-dependent protease with chaperone function